MYRLVCILSRQVECDAQLYVQIAHALTLCIHQVLNESAGGRREEHSLTTFFTPLTSKLSYARKI